MSTQIWPEAVGTKGPYGGGTHVILSVIWIEFVLATTFITLRFFTRYHYGKTGGWALSWTTLSWLIGLFAQGLITIAVVKSKSDFGLGWTVPNALTLSWSSIYLTFIAIGLSKVAVISFILALQGTTYITKRYFLYFLAVSNMFVNLTFVFLAALRCRPAQDAFMLGHEASCNPMFTVVKNFGFFAGAYNALTDLFLALYPLLLFSNLQIPTPLKRSITLVMSLGVFAFGCACVKTYHLRWVSDTTRLDHKIYCLTLWTYTEMWVVLITCSIPPLWPLAKKALFGKKGGKSVDFGRRSWFAGSGDGLMCNGEYKSRKQDPSIGAAAIRPILHSPEMRDAAASSTNKVVPYQQFKPSTAITIQAREGEGLEPHAIAVGMNLQSEKLHTQRNAHSRTRSGSVAVIPPFPGNGGKRERVARSNPSRDNSFNRNNARHVLPASFRPKTKIPPTTRNTTTSGPKATTSSSSSQPETPPTPPPKTPTTPAITALPRLPPSSYYNSHNNPTRNKTLPNSTSHPHSRPTHKPTHKPLTTRASDSNLQLHRHHRPRQPSRTLFRSASAEPPAEPEVALEIDSFGKSWDTKRPGIMVTREYTVEEERRTVPLDLGAGSCAVAIGDRNVDEDRRKGSRSGSRSGSGNSRGGITGRSASRNGSSGSHERPTEQTWGKPMGLPVGFDTGAPAVGLNAAARDNYDDEEQGQGHKRRGSEGERRESFANWVRAIAGMTARGAWLLGSGSSSGSRSRSRSRLGS